MSKTPEALKQTPLTVLLLALAAALAALPLLTGGYSCGHDFDFHLRSWMEVSTQWKSGIVKPVWAFHAAWNTGEPRLLFYPPLSWIVGAALTLIVPWSGIAFTYTWLVFLLCGITMHRLLRRWVSPAAAFAGACLYIVNPYMLFCAYERTAYAELMAAAWMPLLLAALLHDRITAWRIALALALLWLTNAPAGVMGCYTILVLAVMRLALHLSKRDTQPWRFAAHVTAGTVLAFALDSVYLVPFAVERRYISLTAALTPAASPDANFLFDHTTDEFHNGVILHSSVTALILVALAIVFGTALLLLQRRTRTFQGMGSRDRASVQAAGTHAITVILMLFSAIILLLQLPLSAAVWHHAPELNFLQFPWRFLAMQGAVTTVVLTLFLQQIQWRRQAWLRLAAMVLVTTMTYAFANRTFRQGCDDEEGLQPQWAVFHQGQGFEQTDEYTPSGDDNDALKVSYPPAWIANTFDNTPIRGDGKVEPGTQTPPVQHVRPDDWRITPTAGAPGQFLIVRLRPFHGWHVLRDGVEVATWQQRPDGLLPVPLRSAGTHQVEVVYRKPWDQWLGSLLSLLACTATLYVARREERLKTVQ